MKLTFYKQQAEPTRIDKSAWLERIGEIGNVMLLDDTELVNPVFLMQTKETVYQSNYLYCDFTKRYYFINHIEACEGGAMRIYCKCDVLFTFKPELYESEAWLEKSDKNDLMMHQDYPFKSDIIYKDYKFPLSPFAYDPPDYTSIQCMLCIMK